MAQQTSLLFSCSVENRCHKLIKRSFFIYINVTIKYTTVLQNIFKKCNCKKLKFFFTFGLHGLIDNYALFPSATLDRRYLNDENIKCLVIQKNIINIYKPK